LDTNLLIAAAYNPRSSSAKIVQAAAEGKLYALASPPILREYRHIIAQATRGSAKSFLRNFLSALHKTSAPPWQGFSADPADDKFVAVSIFASADYLITNDAHLLALRKQNWNFSIMPPRAFASKVLLPRPTSPPRQAIPKRRKGKIKRK
jgi:putative PIN family toxin of toxin-antitoxin system